jgi:hypothetical protein
VRLRVIGIVSAEYNMLSALVVVGAVRLRDAVGVRADSSTLRALVVAVGVGRGHDDGGDDTVRVTLGDVADGVDLVGKDNDTDDVSGDDNVVAVYAEYSTLNALVVVGWEVVVGRCCVGIVSGETDVMFSVLAGGNDDNVGSNAEYSTLRALVVVCEGSDEYDERCDDAWDRTDDVRFLVLGTNALLAD